MADVSVRAAGPADAADIAAVQVQTWQAAYGPLLPAVALATLRTPEAEAHWREAVTSPPSRRHHVLVALDTDRLVGVVAVAPAVDDDLDPTGTDEVGPLLVHPGAGRLGHGSRLLAAAVEAMRADGVSHAVTWAFAADGALQAFYESAGWAADGVSRQLDMGELVPEVRLHTDLAGD
ncbi:MAG: GNAT family N-acetyltransferase [Actinomycetota bacterium]|nr:GNAT family N-acetyltransferase [Actinomycetota bacterium]